jgi:REP element-mobilizing transposase RayT
MEDPSFQHLPHLRPFARQPMLFLTLCTDRRIPVLADTHTHSILRGLWENSAQTYGWVVGQYVVMPDHVHLFAKAFVGAKPMASWIQMWKSLSSRAIATRTSLKPPIWQRDYFDRLLRSSESYGQKWNYVRMNPVRAGLVARPEEWAYAGCIRELRMRE